MRITALFTATLLALGTLVTAQSVHYDFDKSANFSRFTRYAWGRRGARL